MGCPLSTKGLTLGALGLATMLAGCAGMGPTQAPRQAAATTTEAMLPAAPGAVSLALMQTMGERQYTLVARDQRYLSFERPIDNQALWAELGGAPDLLPRARLVVMLAPVGQSTHVAASFMIIAEPGSAGERLADPALAGIEPGLDLLMSDVAATLAEIPNVTATRLASAGGTVR